MKVIEKRVKGKSIELIAISDCHIGSPEFNESLLNRQIDYVKSHKNCYCILNGDIIDACIPSSVGEVMKANKNPQSEINYAVYKFKPIKDKIIAIIDGNHENRIEREVGLVPMQIFASMLEIPNTYSGTDAYIFLTQEVREGHTTKTTTIFVHHGAGGSIAIGGKTKKLQDLSNIADADIYIISHTHSPITFKERHFVPNTQKKTVECRERLFINTSSCLDYGGYGESKMYRPTSNAFPIAKISYVRLCKGNTGSHRQELNCLI